MMSGDDDSGSATSDDDVILTFLRRSRLESSQLEMRDRESESKRMSAILSTKVSPHRLTVYEEGDGSEEEELDEGTEGLHRNAGKYTVVAFLNKGSGGQVAGRIFSNMVTLLGEEFVFDLKACKPGSMPEDKLLPMATDPQVKVLACGGDGTMGWILSAIDKVWAKVLGPNAQLEDSRYKGHLPLAIMPLGTGNDLSRSFRWGGSFSKSMVKAKFIATVERSFPVPLDRWRCVVVPFNTLSKEAQSWVPAMLGQKMRDREASVTHLKTIFEDEKSSKKDDDSEEDQDGAVDNEGGPNDSVSVSGVSVVTDDEQPETQSFDGTFCNYFSIGVDALVGFSFHKERAEHPERFKNPVGNKVKYVAKALSVGGLCGCATKQLPPVLNGKVTVLVEDVSHNSSNDPEAEVDGMQKPLRELEMPKNCRGVVLLNLQSYAGGSKLTNKGSYNDGLIEVVFYVHLAGMATAGGLGPALPMLRYKVAAQTSRCCIKVSSPFHCQVDGEPWLQSEGIIQISYHGRSPVLYNKRFAVCRRQKKNNKKKNVD